MSLKSNKGVIAGAAAGIAAAVLTIVLARLNDGWDNEALRTVINFLASIPILMFLAKLNISDAALNVLFFVHWMLLGGVVGWLLTSKKALSRIVLVVLVVALVISHRIVQVKIEKDLSAALGGFGKLFTGEAYLEEIRR